MHLNPFSGEGMSHVHCPYGVSALMCLKGFGVQQEDLYTVHLKNAQCRDACAVSSLVLYTRFGGARQTVLGTCRAKEIRKCFSCWSTIQLISKGQGIREAK